MFLRIQDGPLKWPKILGIWFYSFCLVLYLTSSSICLPLTYRLHHTGFPDVLRQCLTHTYLNTALAICSLWDIFPLLSTQLSSSSIWLPQQDQTWPFCCTHQLWICDTLPSKSAPIFFYVKHTGYTYAHTYSLYILEISSCTLYYIHHIIQKYRFIMLSVSCLSPLELKP